MTDLGKNLDIKPNLGANKNPGLNPAKKNELTQTNDSTNISNAQIIIENKSVYKNPSISQEQLGFDSQERLGDQLPTKKPKSKTDSQVFKDSKTDLPVDYDIKAKNPILAAQLNNPKINYPKNKKEKKTPPEPSLQVQFNPRKGIAINPRKVKPNIPGRLQKILDDPQKPIEKLIQALDQNENIEVNL